MKYSHSLQAFMRQARSSEELELLLIEINAWRMFGIRAYWVWDELIVEAP